MLKKPDEVWVHRNNVQNQRTATLRMVYLKNYKDGLYAVIANTETEKELQVITWYKVTMDAQRLGELRTGILIKKADL